MRKDFSRQQEINHAMNYKTTMRLSRMLPSKYHNSWLSWVSFLILVCNLQALNVDTTVTFANADDLHELKRIIFSHVLNLPDVRLQLRVCIRNCVGDENLITFVIELIIKTHLVIRLRLVRIHFVYFSVIWRDFIVNIEASLEPALSVFQMTFQ